MCIMDRISIGICVQRISILKYTSQNIDEFSEAPLKDHVCQHVWNTMQQWQDALVWLAPVVTMCIVP